MSEELEILKIVVQRLMESGIEYIVSGSLAANFYAQPRMTRDIDIVIQLSIPEVNKIYDLFKEDFYIDKYSIEEALKDRGMFNIIHNEKVIKVDFIIGRNTEYGSAKFKRKIIRNIDGMPLCLISPEDLILSKLLWAKDSRSQMQLNDVKNIIVFNEDSLDFNYLREWAERLLIKGLLEECLSA